MSGNKCCFGITIRPKDGIPKNSELENKIIKKIEKTANYYHAVAEKDGIERHIHAQLWFNEKKQKGNVKKDYTRIMEKFDFWDVDHKRHSIKIKMCYNDWYDGYCLDNDDKNNDITDVLLDNIPALTEEYYPSEEDQEKWKDESNAVDKTFHHLMVLYQEWVPNHVPTQLCQVSEFMNIMMFKEKRIKVIEDKRRRCQRTECLFYYIRGYAPNSFNMSQHDWNLYQIENDTESD